MSKVELQLYRSWLPRAQMPKVWVFAAHVSHVLSVLDDEDRPIDRSTVNLSSGFGYDVWGTADEIADKIAKALGPVNRGAE